MSARTVETTTIQKKEKLPTGIVGTTKQETTVVKKKSPSPLVILLITLGILLLIGGLIWLSSYLMCNKKKCLKDGTKSCLFGKCTCKTLFKGDTCSTKESSDDNNPPSPSPAPVVTTCKSTTCSNGGVCSVTTVGGLISEKCTCKNGWVGELCDQYPALSEFTGRWGTLTDENALKCNDYSSASAVYCMVPKSKAVQVCNSIAECGGFTEVPLDTLWQKKFGQSEPYVELVKQGEGLRVIEAGGQRDTLGSISTFYQKPGSILPVKV